MCDIEAHEDRDIHGYADCACRDCGNTVVGHDLCAYCEEAGCDCEGDTECNVLPDEEDLVSNIADLQWADGPSVRVLK